MATPWTSKTGAQIIWSARSFIHDLDPSHYAIDPAVATETYRHCVAELAEALPWPNSSTVAMALAPGAYTATTPFSNKLVDGMTDAKWVATDGEAPIEMRPSEELRAKHAADLSVYGAYQRGIPEMWGLERDPSLIMSPILIIYPAAAYSGTLVVSAGTLATEQDPNVSVRADMGFVQTLELKLAARFAESLDEASLLRLGLPATIAAALEARYQTRLQSERERFGSFRRQRAVILGRP